MAVVSVKLVLRDANGVIVAAAEAPSDRIGEFAKLLFDGFHKAKPFASTDKYVLSLEESN